MNLVHNFLAFLCACCLVVRVMSNIDINEFFPQIQGNLTKVTWAHAVNNKSYLDKVLADDVTMMLEADVILYTNESDHSDSFPVMGHSPNDPFDLTLKDFLQNVSDYNAKVNITDGKGKGVKLDFKSREAFDASLQNIQDNDSKSFPLWINADILAGPVQPTNSPVNSTFFLAKAKSFNDSILSLGWTTKVDDGTASSAGYTNDQINEMINTINESGITNNITFPVRAFLTANSFDQMNKLIKSVEKSTLTIWTADGDKVNIGNLKKVILDIGVKKVYVDLPQQIKDELRLDVSASSPAKTISLLSLFLCVLAVIF